MSEAEKTEKITINLGLVDLGQVDLLVQEGFYANRTDLIRTAIRAQLATHAEPLPPYGELARPWSSGPSTTASRPWRRSATPASGSRSGCSGWPASPTTSPTTALATIESVEVLGALRASTPVKAALAGRIA